MSKIYEIQFNENIDYISTMRVVKILGNFSVFNEYFYLNTRLELNEIIDKINNIVKIKCINKYNYESISNDYCKNWCKNILEKIELQKFEKINQDYLQKLNKDLDFFLKLKEENKLDNFIKTELNKMVNGKKDGGVKDTNVRDEAE